MMPVDSCQVGCLVLSKPKGNEMENENKKCIGKIHCLHMQYILFLTSISHVVR